MAKKYIYLKMTKEWGGFRIGEIVRFGFNKGQGRMEKGEGVEVPKQRAVNDPQPQVTRRPMVETATAEPAAEQAVATPVQESKADKTSEESPESKEKTPGKASSKAGGKKKRGNR